MLLDEGIDVKDLQYHNYLGHHDDVAKAVLNGDFDAGAVMESIAYKYKDMGIKFIKISDEIPEFNICVSKDTDVSIADRTEERVYFPGSRFPRRGSNIASRSMRVIPALSNLQMKNMMGLKI